MEQLIWASTQWRGHLALLVCVVMGYVAIRCLLAIRGAGSPYKTRLLACGLGAAALSPVATAPGLGILPVMMATGLVFLAATGARRGKWAKGFLSATGMTFLLVPTALLMSGTIVGIGSGPSMWPTTGKGFSLILIRPGIERLEPGSRIDFRVPMDEAGEDPDAQWPAGNYHKRVIGMPGDHVVVDDYTLRINGRVAFDCRPTPTTRHLRADTWLCAGAIPRKGGEAKYTLTWGEPEIWMNGFQEWKLGPREVLVFGDNMVESGDSRHRGPVPLHWITGTVVETP